MQNRPKIGLALGAGGGRGMAHVGVLQVLEENNIPIDMVSGCSIGALIAAIYAAGTDLYMLEKFIYTLLPKDIIDPTVPTRGGVLSGSKVEELVRVLSHDKSFGQTRIPCYIGAANLSTGKLDLFTEGKLHKAARASMAIPGVFTPVQLNGSWYVDGGTLEELPLSVLREHGADKVIGVDLSIKAHFHTDAANPSAYGSLLRAFDMMQEEISRLKKDPVDVRIRPDVSFMRMVSTGGAERAVQVGRACTEAALPEIRKLLEE